MTDTERIDWLQKHGAALHYSSHHRLWVVMGPHGQSKARTLREAIDVASDALKQDCHGDA